MKFSSLLAVNYILYVFISFQYFDFMTGHFMALLDRVAEDGIIINEMESKGDCSNNVSYLTDGLRKKKKHLRKGKWKP